MFTKSRIFILFLTLLCFIVWLTSDLIKTGPSFTPDAATTQALEPLNPEFDQNALELISKSGSSLPAFNSKIPVKPTPAPTKTPQNSPSPQPVSKSTSTSSASIL